MANLTGISRELIEYTYPDGKFKRCELIVEDAGTITRIKVSKEKYKEFSEVLKSSKGEQVYIKFNSPIVKEKHDPNYLESIIKVNDIPVVYEVVK